MPQKQTIFSPIDYTIFGVLLVAALIFPQYTLGYNPLETVRALEIPYRIEDKALVRIITEKSEDIPLVIVQNTALKAHNALPTSKIYHTNWTIWISVTAYSSTPDQTWGDPFITASGERVREGIIAANFLPMHTKVRFPTLYGTKIFEVTDRMNSRYFYRADIWMETRSEALRFGIRNVPIEILY